MLTFAELADESLAVDWARATDSGVNMLPTRAQLRTPRNDIKLTVNLPFKQSRADAAQGGTQLAGMSPIAPVPLATIR